MTSADIPLSGVAIDNSMPDQTALDVNVGTAGGVGSLAMSGGGLTVRDLNIGADDTGTNAGSFELSDGMIVAGDDIVIGAGSVGTMNMSGGMASTTDDFDINAGSSATVTGGTIRIGDRLNMLDNSTLLVDGGSVIADDDFFFFGDAQITIHSGLLEVVDKLRFDDDPARQGKLTINGGVVRSNEFGFVDDAGTVFLRGVVEINGDGVYQIEPANDPADPITQLTVEEARALIAGGVHFTTSESAPRKLGVQVVVVPEFDGRQNVVMTQVSVVPEPASVVLFGLSALGLAHRQRSRH
jgi:hypothetical protein